MVARSSTTCFPTVGCSKFAWHKENDETILGRPGRRVLQPSRCPGGNEGLVTLRRFVNRRSRSLRCDKIHSRKSIGIEGWGLIKNPAVAGCISRLMSPKGRNSDRTFYNSPLFVRRRAQAPLRTMDPLQKRWVRGNPASIPSQSAE